MPETTTKTIKLAFEVPADLDLPSEDLQRMKELLLDGLRFYTSGIPFDPQAQRLIDALLTES